MLFNSDLLRRFESARLLARRRARGRAAAERRSPRGEAGVEFGEYRAFVPGDDPRRMDWHAYARNRQLVIRLLAEERDTHVYFLLDCSGSMGAGAPPKFDHARRVLGGLAYIALGQLDRVGFVPLGAGPGLGLAPARGRHRFVELAARLEALASPAGRLGLAESASAWLATRPRAGLVVLLSDGFGVGRDDAADALHRLRCAGHEAALVQVLDAEDLEPPPPGEYEMEDAEGGGHHMVVLDAAARRAFAQRVNNFLAEIESRAVNLGAAFLRTLTHEPPEAALGRALAWQ